MAMIFNLLTKKLHRRLTGLMSFMHTLGIGHLQIFRVTHEACC